MNSFKQFKNVATHEAGHALVAYRYDLCLGRITIVPDREAGILGSSQSEGESGNGSTDRDQIVVLYAGRAAEYLFFPNDEQTGYEGDEERAAELLRFQPGGAEQELREMTAEIVAANWREIRELADLLIVEKTICAQCLGVVIGCIDEGIDSKAELKLFRQRFPHRE